MQATVFGMCEQHASSSHASSPLMEFRLLSSFSFSHSLPYSAGASAEGAIATMLIQFWRLQARARVKGKRDPLRAAQAE